MGYNCCVLSVYFLFILMVSYVRLCAAHVGIYTEDYFQQTSIVTCSMTLTQSLTHTLVLICASQPDTVTLTYFRYTTNTHETTYSNELKQNSEATV